jgi:hypothetical protein
MTDGGTQDRRRLIEALAKGMEETAYLADTHLLAGYSTTSQQNRTLCSINTGNQECGILRKKIG